MQQFYFLIHKKALNLDEIRVTKDGFDYCFPRVTKQGYSGSWLSDIQEPHPQPPPRSSRGGL